MKADKIHISQFEFLTLESLEIDREVGEHATASVSGYIRDKDVEVYRGKLLERMWVNITGEDEEGNTQNLMTGMIAGFSLEPQPHATRLTLIIKSGTYLMAGNKHYRSFQDTGLTFLDVLKIINQTYGDADVKVNGGLEASTIDFLLQYNETDWEFISRIASRFGLAVTPAITREGAYYFVGDANYSTYTMPESASFRVSKRVDSYMTQGGSGSNSLMEQDYMEYRITSRDVYDLWDRLVLGNEGGYICKIQSKYVHEELTHTYTLRPINGMRVMLKSNMDQSGCSFIASVIEVTCDMVKIELAGDENASQNITKWFPYSTGYSSPDGAGWYCMPEPGDRVRLQIPDQMEEHGYVISSVHMETGKDRKNPDHKSFKTKYGKELLFTPDSVELTNNKGMSIRIKDEEGIQIISNKDISISSGDNMTVSSEDASLVIAGKKQINIKQGGSGLSIDKDITFTGGKIRIQ